MSPCGLSGTSLPVVSDGMRMLVVFVVLLGVTQNASAVEVDEGVASVVLSCTGSNTTTSVLWSRNDLSPSTIYLLQLNGPNLQNQNQNFRNRTSMKSDALQTGDVSLTLTQPHLFDSGNYTCTVRGNGPTQATYQFLTVTSRREMDLQNQVTALGASLGVVLGLVAVSVILAHHFKYLRFSRSSGPEDKF